MALSQRLSKINQMVKLHYSHIWDCCCDHGQLGIALLERNAADTIHFVDVVPALMSDLETRLNLLPCSNTGWQVHNLDVAQLPIRQTATQIAKPDSQLIIIAGIGGDLLITLTTAIINNNPDKNLEFLLCPVYHQYKVRSALIELGLHLKAEHLLRDNKQFYEILHVTTHSTLPAKAHTATNYKPPVAISPIGSSMWDFSQQHHRDYYQSILDHYGRMQTHSSRRILKHYQSELDPIFSQ